MTPPNCADLRPALPTNLSPGALRRCRQHFGSEPHYFWVVFPGDAEPRLLGVEEVWRAHQKGKRPERFEAAPLRSAQRSLLRYLASTWELSS